MKNRHSLVAFAAAAAVLALPAVAAAADLPRRASDVTKAPVVAPAPTWTGFYVGAQIGYGWADAGYSSFWNAPGVGIGPGTRFGLDGDGVLGGLHAGYNLQLGQFVVGVEGDIEAAAILARGAGLGGTDLVGPPVGPFVLGAGESFRPHTDIDWLASLRGRVGFTVMPTLLAYVTGGVGFAGVESSSVLSVPGGIFIDRGSETRVGWTLGAGLEWAVARNWSVRAEYRYYDFGTHSYTRGIIGPAATLVAGTTINHRFDTDLHTARVGVSYRF